MEDAAFTPNSMFGETLSDTVIDLDLMEELLFEGCWLESSDGFNFLQTGPLTSGALDNPLHYMPSLDANTGQWSINPHQQIHQENTERKINENPPLVYPKEQEVIETNLQNTETNMSLIQPGNFLVESTESGKRWWIGPSSNPSPSSSVRDRLMQAIGYLKKFTEDKNVLIQIWVPIKEGGRLVLTTKGQPYSLNSNCASLASYRHVSKEFQFAAEQDSKALVGFPSRVFLGKLPEWTPDVRFFRRDEYPRIAFAEQYKVRGSIALPVFERGSGTCLGVVEVVTTTQRTNYRPELENVCKALEAVDLRSSQNFCTPSVKAFNQAAVPKIAEILASVCNTHRLPLALTWAPCVQQCKDGFLNSEKNCASCFTTVDSACIVAIKDFSSFHEACSEHHLFQGQGIVGRAFTTNKKCFATNVASFSKTNYPFSHHARMFGLCAAVAYPLRSIYTGSIEFILELFLPKDCQETEQQKWMLNSLSIVIQQACQNLHFVMDEELEEEVILPVREMVVASDGRLDEVETQKSGSSSKESSPERSPWISHMMEAQQKGTGVSVSWEFQKEEPMEEVKVTTHWDNAQAELYHNQVFSEFGKFQQNSGPKSSAKACGDSSSFGGHHLSAGRKAGRKRRTKMEKAISLEVLRQHFSGSLKDAAKSIGVCPTTLKRICRQHGITRWPSRKIKKVGHSLRKLQLVIDSVQGAEGAIQIGSFYTSFPELSSPKTSDHSKQLDPQPESGLFTFGATAPKSPSSSCSRSSGSSTCCSTGVKQLRTTVTNASTSGDALMVEEPGGLLKRVRSDAELLALNHEVPTLLARFQSHKTFGEHPNVETLPPLQKGSHQTLRDAGVFRVKATFGEEKFRFPLQPNWGFGDLQQEIARRFNIDDVSRIDLKYLDDDHEWVLLTCEADLEECIDIYRSIQSHTIKISVHQTTHKILVSSFGSMGSS